MNQSDLSQSKGQVGVTLDATQAPLHPPAYPGPRHAAPSTWPMVIGVILIVVGSGGILTNGCGGILGQFFSIYMLRTMSQSPAGDTVNVQLQVMQEYLVLNVANATAATLLAVVVLIGGIGLIRRRPWSRRCLLTWAILRMLQALPSAGLQYVVMKATFAAMESAAASQPASAQAGAPPGWMFGMLRGLGIFGVVVHIAWAWAVPVFVLIWFSRRRIAGEMKSWRGLMQRGAPNG